jgi:hypothetical protein
LLVHSAGGDAAAAEAAELAMQAPPLMDALRRDLAEVCVGLVACLLAAVDAYELVLRCCCSV